MLRILGNLARGRPGTAVLALTLLGLIGAAGGFYAYALGQWQVARTAVREGRFADARKSLDVCLFVWPRSVPVHLLAARAARLSGDFPAAEAHLNKCLKLEKGSTDDIQLEFLLMRVQRGGVDEVAPALIRCVENKHPQTPLILETVSLAYMRNLQYGPALACLDRWVKEAPDSAVAFHRRGWVRERINNNAGAMKDYQRALELNPGLVDVRLRLVEMLLEKVNVPEALPHLERLMKEHPDRADVQARMGQCRLLQGKPREARRLLEAAAEKMPDDPALLLDLAKLEKQEGQPGRAEERLRRLLKMNPTYIEAQYQLVNCLQLQGRHKEAKAALRQYEKDKALLKRINQLLQEEAEHPSQEPGPAYELGEFFLRNGQDRVGLFWLDQVRKHDPAHRLMHKALAEYYEKKGDGDKAAEHRRWLQQPARPAAPPGRSGSAAASAHAPPSR